jgi:hypothetical protein
MKEIVLNEKIPLSKSIPKRVIDVEMFRAGEQTDSDGDRALFTEQDLEDIITSYDPASHEAPLIVGHDQNDSTPSLGWVKNLWRRGKSLWGKIELTPKAEKMISEGIFKKVSSSFYAPEADANPHKGKLSLRHLALVNIPAVKGLADFREQLSDTINIDFSEKRSKALFKELLDKNTSIMAKPRKKRISNHAEGPMHVTINVGGSSGGEDLPLYDDSGNQLTTAGTPVDYEEEEEMEEMDLPEDEMEYDEDEELEEGMDEEGMDEEGMDEEGMDEEGLDEEGLDEGMDEEMDEGMDEEPEDLEGGGDEVEDISDDMDDDEDKISELATSYSPLELAKALMLQKQTNNMMESNMSQDFSEKKEETEYACSDDKKSKKMKKYKEKDEEEMSEDYAEEEEEEEKDEKEMKKKEECDDDDDDDDEEETKDHGEESMIEDYSEEEDEEDEEEDEDSESSESLKERVARLEKELVEQKKLAREKEISDFCEKVYQNGKLTEQIVSKTDLVRFMGSLNGKNAMNFSESGRQSQFDFFSNVLVNLPQLVNFSEVAPEGTAPKRKKVSPPASGYEYDGNNLDLHTKALEFSEAKGVDYITALKTIME